MKKIELPNHVSGVGLYGRGHLAGQEYQRELDIKQALNPTSMSDKWPSLKVGDTVNTPEGNGELCSIYDQRRAYYVQFEGAGGECFERHQLALINKRGNDDR